MNNYTYVTEKLIDLEIAPKNANNLEELIQQTRENIRNKQYLVDEIKEVFSLYDKIEKTNEFVLIKTISLMIITMEHYLMMASLTQSEKIKLLENF